MLARADVELSDILAIEAQPKDSKIVTIKVLKVNPFMVALFNIDLELSQMMFRKNHALYKMIKMNNDLLT